MSRALNRISSEPRLLIIDDDRSVLFAFRRLFGTAGIKVDTCESLEEAKEMIDKHPYRVILTDLKFSEVVEEAGIVICAYAKARDPRVKVILWTATDVASIRDKAQAARVDFCFMKPLSPEVIQGVVASLYGIPENGKATSTSRRKPVAGPVVSPKAPRRHRRIASASRCSDSGIYA